MQFIKKYSVLIGIVVFLLLITIAISIYPGGSFFDHNTVGFNLTQNFLCNLFGPLALNGAENPSRIWATAGIILLSITYAIFFFNMSKKIPDRNAAGILKYGGIANMLPTSLIATGLHDLMLIIYTTLFWTCMIFVTVFIFKTRLHLFKIFCLISLLLFYYSVYLWATNNWILLAIMQKVNFVTSTLLILSLEYFTTTEDFAHIKLKRQKINIMP